MKNLAKTLEPITFSFCTLIAILSVELSSLSPAKAKTYYGGNADVTVFCEATGDQSYGNFSIDGRRSGIELTSAEGFVYFDNDPRSAQVIFVSTPLRMFLKETVISTHFLPLTLQHF